MLYTCIHSVFRPDKVEALNL